ncbi:hypothetical protein [Ketogulonicigenium vulgare]|nr:hypothetical protein [Ketogulonicigenium vulgare]
MSERFVEAIGARDMREVQDAIYRLFGSSRRALPLKEFAALNGACDWRMLMGTDFAVVHLSASARNLSAYVVLPAQVGFIATVTEEGEGLAAVQAQHPNLLNSRPGFIIPPLSEPAQTARRIALEQRVRELANELDGRTPAELAPDDPRQSEAQRLSIEWAALFPRNGQQPAQRQSANVN